ncbi:hypothetical protein PILCRDRAFT_86432 [Piloderma croceum F 1598]|uniref:Protein kinase domain-containing protein n=1 Tax=Piloderma croceum (strain F 1598) TaxID=765440 RepID=A0A0C3CAS6_PILCF|nr:hypothetical protein PILCRDRAFT_86432 [Piloderma croceum F 1598]
MTPITDSPPKAPPIKYTAHLGTRWEKEKAAAEQGAFEHPDDAKYVGPWIIGECVGKGASGRVKIAKHRFTGQLAAVKILPLQPLVNSRASLATQQAKSEKQRLGIDREITMMKLMNHPNIMRIYDVYEGEKELYLVLEYVEGGELFDFLVNRGRLPTIEALAYFKQIVYGLNYAHTFSIIHRDLKPENILIHSLNPPLIKIADWGMAAFAPPELQLETSCGSPHYASPEIVNGSKYEGNATDIWSCGVILYALLTGRLPFDDKNVRTLLSKVKVGKYDMPAYVDPLAKNLLARMLVVDVNRRITIPEILSHPWLRASTPGIIYVPAPPVAELARPLRSAAYIDRDLFESLVVIWGRNADREEIKADLLSPPGSGILAKAFYFLLHIYREQTLKDNGIVDDDNYGIDGKIITKQYTAPPTRSSNQLGVKNASLRVRSSREAPAPPSRSPSPRVSAVLPQHVAAVPSSSRPTSPAGPRQPKQRPISSPIPTYALPKTIGLGPGRLGPDRPSVTRRSSAVPTAIPNLGPRPLFLQGRDPTVFQPMQYESPPKTSIVRFPVITPRHSAVPALSPQTAPAPTSTTSFHEPMPMLRAPRTANAEFQRTIDDITDKVNMLVAHGNAAHALEAKQDVHGYIHVQGQGPSLSNTRNGNRQSQTQGFVHAYTPANFILPESDISDERDRWNKENKDDRKLLPHPGGDRVPMSGGLFARRNGTETEKEPTKGKEKRSRPPTLDLHGLHPKRSAIGSPNPMASPAMSILASPVVGEFKGWFSNLFNWKSQTYVLCSTDNIFTTRQETTRLLEQFGVVVALEDADGWGQLRCRVDDILDAPTGTIAQKQTRFRVELYSAPGNAYSPHPGEGTTSRLSQQNSVSPHLNPTRYSMNKYMMNGSQCAILLIQEKGAVSAFRAVCRKLREEWTLDALQSPVIRPDGNTPLGGHAQKLVEGGEHMA